MGTKKAGELNGGDVYVDVDEVVIKKSDLEKYKQYEQMAEAWQDDNHVPVNNNWYQKMLLIEFDNNTPIDNSILKELREKATAYEELDLENNQLVGKEEFDKLVQNTIKLLELDLEKNVLVNRDQFAEFLAQNTEYKADIIEMVNVFQVFAGLFEGKGVMSVIPVITKMMKDKTKMAELSGIVRVIDKYTTKNPEING